MINILRNKNFEKKLKKFDLFLKKQFEKRLDIFCSDRFHTLLNNHSVDPPHKNTRSINITGDIRAFYIEIEKDTFLFVDIGSHSDLYK